MNITHISPPDPSREGVGIIVEGYGTAVIELTKKYLLDLGIAIIGEAGDGDTWTGRINYKLPADPKKGRGETVIEGGTDDPVIVCIARRFWNASNAEDYWFPYTIPSRQEAIAELADPKAWKQGI